MLLDQLKVLSNLKELTLNWTGRFDGQPAVVNSMQLVAGNNVKINVKFTADEKPHTINASYTIKGKSPDIIKFDGREVEDDDVDFDIIFKFTHVVFQYEFRFTDQSTPHEFVARAKHPLPLLI
jgi:hypothetical protein